MTFSYGVDVHPAYQHPYQGSHEWPVHFVVQKVAQWPRDYTKETDSYHARWLSQKLSIPKAMPLGCYMYYKTDASGLQQAEKLFYIMQDEGYDFCAMDFESGYNEIIENEVKEYVDAMIHLEVLCSSVEKKEFHYTNGWIDDYIEYYCISKWGGKYKEWYQKKMRLWEAGGELYGQLAGPMPSPNYDPFPNDAWIILQFYADNDDLGERTGFKDGDIDYNRMRIPSDELHEYFNTGRGEVPPVAECGEAYLRGYNDGYAKGETDGLNKGWQKAIARIQRVIDRMRDMTW